MNATDLLTLDGIAKAFGSHQALADVSFTLKPGEIGCLLGPSGCGKTTLLRLIAGFETPDAGSIGIGGQVVAQASGSLEPEKRNVGMVFQDYALFPHLTALENVIFGLHGLPARQRKTRGRELLETVGLSGAEKRYPHELSGGQQQRVALARALAPEPKLLLLDEPFSNLDMALRERLSIEVRDIIKANNATAIMVTHSQQEAFAMADRVGVMAEGRMLQWAAPHVVYHRPVNKWAATFVGEGAIISGTVTEKGSVVCALGELCGEFSVPCPDGCAVDILIRPEDIIHDDASPAQARIVRRTFRGPNILYSLQLENGETVQALVDSHHRHPPGQLLGIRPNVEDIVLFPKSCPLPE